MVLPSESGDKRCYKCHLFLAAPAGAYGLIPTNHAHNWAELAGSLSSRSAGAQLVRASGRNSTFHLIWIPPTTMLATPCLPLIPMLHKEWIKKKRWWISEEALLYPTFQQLRLPTEFGLVLRLASILSQALSLEILPGSTAPNTETYHSVSQSFALKGSNLR